MTSFVFRETFMSHLLLWSNGYAQIIWNGKGSTAAVIPTRWQSLRKEESDNSNKVNKVNNDKKEETNKKEKEELPKTGLESEKTISMALLALAAAIAVRRKQKQ